MEHVTRRGFVPSDIKEFSSKNLLKLYNAQKDIFYLIEKGYPIKSASTFVGNHYILSERQRLALVRATSTKETILLRQSKQKLEPGLMDKVHIDGLNLIITLEVALSGSPVILCMDGTVRDLAGLRGTYRLIDKTDLALKLIGNQLEQLQVREANFYLDAPVSNTGRLKTRIHELLAEYPFHVNTELVHNADVLLEQKENVISSDAIVLNKCNSWINLGTALVKKISDVFLIDFSMKNRQ